MEKNYYEFCKRIADDFKLDINKVHKTHFSTFPIVNGKKKIHASGDSIIVDNQGNEYPYMISQHHPAIRNNEKLIDFDYIYCIRPKNLEDIIKETGIVLETKPCRICEGNGWYSNGIEYFYKDISCKV